MKTQRDQKYQNHPANSMRIGINTSGIVMRILVCLLAFLTVIIVGCDMYDSFQQEVEPNGSYATATEFQMSDGSWAGVVPSIDDKDYFKVYLTEGYTYQFRLTHLQNDLNMLLYDDGELWVQSSLNTGLDDEVVSVAVPVTAWYYLLVEASQALDPPPAPDTYFGKYVIYQTRE
ncbi:MAG: PPC domain-containing protein [Sphaerochaetaceae bacterium]